MDSVSNTEKTQLKMDIVKKNLTGKKINKSQATFGKQTFYILHSYTYVHTHKLPCAQAYTHTHTYIVTKYTQHNIKFN